MTILFGKEYSSSQTRTLGDISKSQYPETSEEFQKTIYRHENEIDYITSYMRVMQKGIDQANRNVIEKIQDFIRNIIVLFGGGQLLTGMDLGDLQYFIPAISALFGFEGPFPINLVNAAMHFLLGYVVPSEQFTDIIFDIISAWMESLGGLLEDFPVVGPIFDQFSDYLNMLLSISRDAINALDLFGSFFGGGGTDGAGGVDWFNIATWINLPSAFLTGQLPFNLLGLIPFSHVGNNNPNLLLQPGFDTSTSVKIGPQWTWDTTTGRTEAGSAKVIANATELQTVSNEVRVTQDQKFDLSIYAKWSGLTYTGTTPFNLGVVKYLNDVAIGADSVAAFASPPATQATWQQLSATYTVPAGVDEIRLQLRVAPQCTSGTIWWDDAVMRKTGYMSQGWIGGLVEQFSGILDMFGLGFLGDLIGIDVDGTWGNIITSMLNPLELLQDVFSRNMLQEFVDALDSILRRIPFVGGTLAAIWSNLFDFILQGDDTLTTTVSTRESIVTNITGNTTTDPANSDVDAAISGQTDALAAQAAAIAALQQVQTGQTGGGISALEQFEYTDLDSLEPTLWERTVLTGTNITNGTIAVADGHNAGMVAGSSAANYEEWNLYIGPNRRTLTQYQRVGFTIATQMSSPGFFDSRVSAIDLYGRCSDDKTKWCRFRWRSNGEVRFYYKNGGAVTQLGSTSSGWAKPAVGQNIWMDCGTSGGVNIYRLYRGSQVIHTITDSGHVIDETQKGYGWGQFNDSNLLPGKITQFSGADNAPAPIVGTTFRAYRSSTSGLSQTSGTQICASNTFDTVDYISADLTWDATTSKLTVTKSGTYLVSSRYCFTAVIGSNEEWDNAVFKNGTIHSYGNSYTGLQETATSNDNENRLDAIGGGMMTVYLAAGQYIQFGYFLSGARSIKGDAAGSISWVTAVRLGVTS